MHSKDVLLDALKDFGGTVIFVSHDRGFIEDLSTRVLELHPGSWRNFVGNYKYYMQRLADEELSSVKKVEEEVPVVSSNKISWEEKKKAEAQRRKLEKEVKVIEEKIAELEGQKASLEESLSNPQVYSNGAKAKEVQDGINDIEKKLESLNLEWEEKAELLG